ncbi:MAG: hypothetical protein U9R47_07640, partial [Actinomycetota bacterium]|nr:hypothetical protein [Actinomycetota bacterium]
PAPVVECVSGAGKVLHRVVRACVLPLEEPELCVVEEVQVMGVVGEEHHSMKESRPPEGAR